MRDPLDHHGVTAGGEQAEHVKKACGSSGQSGCSTQLYKRVGGLRLGVRLGFRSELGSGFGLVVVRVRMWSWGIPSMKERSTNVCV